MEVENRRKTRGQSSSKGHMFHLVSQNVTDQRTKRTTRTADLLSSRPEARRGPAALGAAPPGAGHGGGDQGDWRAGRGEFWAWRVRTLRSQPDRISNQNLGI